MILSLAGILLALVGSLLGLIGAWGTSGKDLKTRHFGFLLWSLNSPMLVLSMIGIAAGWWESISILPMIGLNLVYWGTAVRGWRNTRPVDELMVCVPNESDCAYCPDIRECRQYQEWRR